MLATPRRDLQELAGDEGGIQLALAGAHAFHPPAGLPGGLMFGATGLVLGGTMGGTAAALDSIDPSPRMTLHPNQGESVPGLVKAMAWGLVGAGITALGISPEHWVGPYGAAGAWLTTHLSNDPLVLGFASGVAARVTTAAIVNGSIAGAGGLVLGGAGTGRFTGKLMEKIQQRFSRKAIAD